MDDYNEYAIYKGKFWEMILHPDDQYFLGRSIARLRRDIENPLKITEEEKNELWENILPKLSRALEKAFGADRINYCHLANSWHHVHWHIIPRYEKNPARDFAGELFKDDFLGRNPYNGVPKKSLPDEIMNKICAEIKKNFK